MNSKALSDLVKYSVTGTVDAGSFGKASSCCSGFFDVGSMLHCFLEALDLWSSRISIFPTLHAILSTLRNIQDVPWTTSSSYTFSTTIFSILSKSDKEVLMQVWTLPGVEASKEEPVVWAK
jgi:hypothetical protein